MKEITLPKAIGRTAEIPNMYCTLCTDRIRTCNSKETIYMRGVSNSRNRATARIPATARTPGMPVLIASS
jgi:hypothetical protein